MTAASGRPHRERRATARQVAELAGVSISAVSRTFTKGASVSAATRQKVLAATRSLGYQPNLLARSLMTRRTELIGLISNNFDNPAFMEIFDLFTRRLQQRGLRPLLANLSGGAGTEGALDMLLQYHVDGVIVASSTLPPQFAEACAEARLPVVQAFGRPGGARAVNVVGADNLQGGRLAADLLCRHGYRNIAFLGGPQGATSTEDRLEGLSANLAKAGLRLAADVYGHSYSHEAGIALMRELLKRGHGIDAVFCGDDILAIGALDACREAGVDVPGRIGIVGFNDIAMAGWPAYNLTTIRQPIADIIATAIDLVLSVVDEPDRASQTRMFGCEAVLRGTLRAPN
ncbi:MAG: LacI family DNA-binding transcriptional regulator [Methylobacteriaceae bacterium]|nr:LacI family DNA-binding transcriptional regulator [Methylobacteriaceae bacterium]